MARWNVGRRTPMNNRIGRRELFGAGIGLCASLAASSALGQSSETAPRESGTDALGRRVGAAPRRKEIPKRMAKTRAQKSVSWVQEQGHEKKQEAAWLIDWNGKLLHTVMTNCKDASGMCFGAGYVWSGASGASVIEHPTPPINGIFQTDMNGK